MLCCIVGVLVVVASDSTQTYHVAVRRGTYAVVWTRLIDNRLLDSYQLA